MKSKIVVSDTTAITHLARVGALNLIHQLYLTIYIPEAVHSELTSHGMDIPGAKEVKRLPWIKTQKVKNRERVKFHSSFLDPGESEAIALAEEMHADILIIDEKIGRGYAKSLGLQITGMAGILLLAKEQKLIPLVKPYLDRLMATKFKLGLKLYEQALELAGEKRSTKKA
jgi:predicted nucleic acid-binding protein